MSVRPARGQDAGDIIRLTSIMYQAMGVDASSSEWKTEVKRVLLDRASSEDCAIFVAEDDDRVVACGGVTVAARLPGPNAADARSAYVQWMVTEPRYRRQGHARAVFGAIMEWVEARGIRLVELHATPDGEALYRAYGFVSPKFPMLRFRFAGPDPPSRSSS
jgi:GNAT superfamily N-acetyltransferase